MRLCLLLLAVFTCQVVHAQAFWKIEDSYEVRFSGSGAEGTFLGLTGEVRFDLDDLSTASFKVEVDPSTIDTGNRTKDKHAKGKSWFRVALYPELTFTSTRTEKGGPKGYRAYGILNMHGIEKETTIDFTYEGGENAGKLVGTLSIDRTEWGIKGPLLGVVVGNVFEVDLSVPVTKLK